MTDEPTHYRVTGIASRLFEEYCYGGDWEFYWFPRPSLACMGAKHVRGFRWLNFEVVFLPRPCKGHRRPFLGPMIYRMYRRLKRDD